MMETKSVSQLRISVERGEILHKEDTTYLLLERNIDRWRSGAAVWKCLVTKRGRERVEDDVTEVYLIFVKQQFNSVPGKEGQLRRFDE
jgi:hypothetical protein